MNPRPNAPSAACPINTPKSLLHPFEPDGAATLPLASYLLPLAFYLIPLTSYLLPLTSP